MPQHHLIITTLLVCLTLLSCPAARCAEPAQPARYLIIHVSRNRGFR